MKNKNGWNSALILSVSAVVMILLVILISVLSVKAAVRNGGVHIVFGGRAELRNTIELSSADADELEIRYSSKNIYVYPSEDDHIVIKEYLLSKSPDAQAQVSTLCDADTGENTVTITGGCADIITIFGFFSMDERIEVYLPQNAPKELLLCTSSGNIMADDIFSMQADRLELTASSGNIVWSHTDAGELHIKTNSGNIRLTDMKGDAEIAANSGNIRLTDITGNVETAVGSGNIVIEGFSGAGSMTAGSGNIKMQVERLEGDLALKTRSGNSRLILPKQSAFSFEAETGSGNINTFFDEALTYNKKGNQAKGTVGENPEALVRVEANSGNVTITAE